jgi:diaminopimelate decarboxylase
MTAPRHHVVLDSFAGRDGVLMVGGRPVTDWVAQAGTPLFLYDRVRIAARIAAVRAALPPQVALHYAIKANPMTEVLAFMAPLVDGFDVASAGELGRAVAAGMAPAAISFAGPGKTVRDHHAAARAGVTLNAESLAEVQRYAAVCAADGVRGRVALRLNPDFELKGSGMRMGGGAKPFGMDIDQVPAALAACDASGLAFAGFHIYAGSQALDAGQIVEAQTRSLDLGLRLAAENRRPLASLNIGGGFGIPYVAGDPPLDLAAVGAGLAQALAERASALAGTEIIVELGRYLVGEAGVYLARVIERKHSHCEVFLITDGGLHHQLAASGNFGQVIKRNYPVAVATRWGAPPAEPVQVVGCLCTPLDRLADKAALPTAAEGDLVAVFCAGAYGLSASPIRFLDHPEPAELLV